MAAPNPKIGDIRPAIRQLDEAAINRIAAGEVVERPASAVKELVENALDAGAQRIEVAYADGGKTRIRVTDDGHGMSADDLPLALSRHATSKIDGSDLLNIHSFGFRGEALPSLGAVGRLAITSRAAGAEAATIIVAGGRASPVRPAALRAGTVVDLADLFYATPARLKFLRTDRAEAQAIGDVIKRLAMAEPFVSFTVRDISDGGEGRVVFRADAETGDMFDALHRRLARVLGSEFAENALALDAEREGLHLTGYAALPTYSRGSAVAQYLYRQWTPGARQDAARRAARRLHGFPLARPASGGGAFPRLRPGPGRRERASRQGRGPVPRARCGTRVDRLGAAARAGGGRAPRLDHGGGGDPWRDATRTRWPARLPDGPPDARRPAQRQGGASRRFRGNLRALRPRRSRPARCR